MRSILSRPCRQDNVCMTKSNDKYYLSIQWKSYCYSNHNIASYIKEVETYSEKIYLEQ